MSTAGMAMESSSNRKFTVSQAILWGGLAAGLLDATDGVVAYYLHARLNPVQVLQYIASGALGPSAFQGGLTTAAVGAGLHFFIAFVVAAVYVGAARKLPPLHRNWIGFGLLFGAAVYLMMTYVVLPISAVAPSPFHIGMFLNGVLGHALFVGLPVAFYSRRTA